MTQNEGSPHGEGNVPRSDVPCSEGVDEPGDGWRPSPPSGTGAWRARDALTGCFALQTVLRGFLAGIFTELVFF